MARNILIVLLAVLGLVMIYLGASNKMLPPALTGVGFLLICGILKLKE